MSDDFCFDSKIFKATEDAVQFLLDSEVIKTRKMCDGCGNLSLCLKFSGVGPLCKVFYKCSTKNCRKTRSIYKEDTFKSCKLALNKLLFSIYLVLLNVNNYAIRNLVGIKDKAVIGIKNKLNLQFTAIMNKIYKIGGPGIEVQLDESVICRRGTVRCPTAVDDNISDTVWIFGGCEKNNPTNFFVCRIPDRKSETLKEMIKKYVEFGSIICTDGYPSYPRAIEELGMLHKVVNHIRGFVNSEGDHTNNIENLWSHMKLEVRKRNGVMRTNIDLFLAEFFIRKRLLSGYSSRSIYDLWFALIKLIF